jgi:hypothetical protein
MANEVDKKLIMSLFVKRYKHAKDLVNGILTDINILEYFPKGVDPVGLYLNKIFGFNCALEAHLKRIESREKLWAYRFKLISYLASFKYLKKSKILEIDPRNFKHTDKKYLKKIDILYVATLENYAKALLIHALDIKSKSKGRNIVFFLPFEAKKWHTLLKIKQQFDVIYPSNIGLSLDKYILQSENYKKIIRRGVNNIEKDRFLYKGFSYFKISIKSISYFFIENVSTNIVFLSALHLFFKESVPSKLYIARDRRTVENSFVQILASLGTKTSMVLHGVITSNYNHAQLFTSHYQYVNCVEIWGEQQLCAIKRKQEALQEKMPIIIKTSKKFNVHLGFKSKDLIVVVGGKTNDNDLYCLSKKIVKMIKNSRFKVVFRPHPDNASSFKEVEKMYIDSSSNFSSSTLSRASLVITQSSTALLEGVSFGAGCVILDYSKFNQIFPTIYTEECDFISKNKYLVSHSDEESLYLIDEYISSEDFAIKNRDFSKKMYLWFVG